MADPSSSRWPDPTEGDYTMDDFHFQDGTTLPELKLHYRTLGALQRDRDGRAANAVLIMHGTTGEGSNFLTNAFAGVLFNRGQLLDADKYFLILPDSIGHGSSSKPSHGLRNRFPNYCYGDMVTAQHRLLTQHLKVDHLRLIMGASMGGMHTWLWGTTYPDMMDALMPLASLPSEIAGRNRMMRKMAIDSIRNSPDYHDGEYTAPPRGLLGALQTLFWMSSCPLRLQRLAPDRESADEMAEAVLQLGMARHDANDFAYAFDASRDYDPRPRLSLITAALTAVNSADDQVNPPELRILETEMRRVPGGRAVVLPISNETVGHGTHSVANAWKEHLAELLQRSRRPPAPWQGLL